MEIKITKIGDIDEGLDGRDEYLLLKRLDDDLTPEQAVDHLTWRCHRNCTRPGGYYCTTIRAVQVQHSTNEVICTVEHRYDV